MSHVFISYAHEDEKYALELAGWLRSEGLPVWIDKYKFVAGAHMIREAYKAILDAFAFVVIMSPAAADSLWVKREVEFAEDVKCDAFPLRYKVDNFKEFVIFARYEDTFVVQGEDGQKPQGSFFRALKEKYRKSSPDEENSHFFKIAWSQINKKAVESRKQREFTVMSEANSLSLWRMCIRKAKYWQALSYALALWTDQQKEESAELQKELIKRDNLSRIFVFDTQEEKDKFYNKNRTIIKGDSRWILKAVLLEYLEGELDSEDIMLDFALANFSDYVLWFRLEDRELKKATLSIGRSKLHDANIIYNAALDHSQQF